MSVVPACGYSPYPQIGAVLMVDYNENDWKASISSIIS